MGIKIENLCFSYDGKRQVLAKINMALPKGKILGVLGPNGTGKTTLLKCLNKIFTAQAGRVMVNGQDIYQLTAQERAKIIAYVPQYANASFNARVIDTIMLGRLPYAANGYSEQDQRLTLKIIEQMDLEGLALNYLNSLSGGERQRVLIARALVQEPQIILLDEPTSSLDLYNQLFIMRLITRLAQEQQLTVIMTIHDINLAAMFCDAILMLKNSHVFAYGTPEQVLTEANINSIYNVNVKITHEEGYRHIRLLKESGG